MNPEELRIEEVRIEISKQLLNLSDVYGKHFINSELVTNHIITVVKEILNNENS